MIVHHGVGRRRLGACRTESDQLSKGSGDLLLLNSRHWRDLTVVLLRWPDHQQYITCGYLPEPGLFDVFVLAGCGVQ